MSQSGMQTGTDIPRELDRWNWGAFLLNWIWAIGNSTWIGLLALIPLVNIVMMIVLGMKGSRWAWRNRVWRDAEHFRRTQRGWAIAGMVLWAFFLVIFVGVFLGVTSLFRSSEPYQLAMQELRASEAAISSLGEPIQDGWFTTGNIAYNADGGGKAEMSIPVSGPRASGRLVVMAEREGGVWRIILAVLRPAGGGAPIVILNPGNIPIPGAALGA